MIQPSENEGSTVIVDGKCIRLPLNVILQDGRKAILHYAPNAWVGSRFYFSKVGEEIVSGIGVKEYIRDENLLKKLSEVKVQYDQHGNPV